MKIKIVISVLTCTLSVVGFAQNSKTDSGCELPAGIKSKELSYNSFYLQPDYMMATVNIANICPTPSWKPETLNQPLSISEAIQKSQDFLAHTYTADFLKMYELESVQFKKFLKDKWYYVINYERNNPLGGLAVVVKLDGKILSTKTTEQKRVSERLGFLEPKKSIGTMILTNTEIIYSTGSFSFFGGKP